jgi:hypothetical protein
VLQAVLWLCGHATAFCSVRLTISHDIHVAQALNWSVILDLLKMKLHS